MLSLALRLVSLIGDRTDHSRLRLLLLGLLCLQQIHAFALQLVWVPRRIRHRVLPHQVDRGLGVQHEPGTLLAEGQYVRWLHVDSVASTRILLVKRHDGVVNVVALGHLVSDLDVDGLGDSVGDALGGILLLKGLR